MTDDQRQIVWATVYGIHFERLCHGIDPRLDQQQRLAYLARASEISAARAYDAISVAPVEA